MSAPFHMLKHEHRIIEQVLRALEGVCFRLKAQESVPTADIVQLVDFISVFADGYHHAKEEMYLFPALLKQGFTGEEGALGAISHEHQTERDLVQKLLGSINGLEAGNAAAIGTFTEAASRYVSHMLGHMRHEDATLFRLAEEMMDTKEKASLYSDFKHAEDEMGIESVREYEDLASSLEERWAI